MATTSTKRGGKYVDFDEFIDFQLQKTRSNIKATDVLTALAGVGTMFLAYLLVFVVFDHWIVPGGFGTVARWLMLGGLLVASAVWVAWRVVMPSRRNVTGLYAAKAIETTEPGLKNNLVNLVDLRRAGKPVPEEIERALEKRAAVTLSRTNVENAVDRRPLMRLSYALAALVVACCLYTLFSPKKISASVWRALFPASETEVDTAFKIDKVFIELDNEKKQSFLVYRREKTDEEQHPDLTIAARSRVKVYADLRFANQAPDEVLLYYSTRDRKFVDVKVRMNRDPNEDKRYWARLTGVHGRGLMQTTTYRIEAGDASAGPFTLSVVRPPVATVETVHYDYPAYMQREPRTQDGGQIETWEGTAVTVNARTDQPVKEAWIVFTETENPHKPALKRRMEITDGTQLSVRLQREIAFRPDGSYPHFYHVECIGANGYTDPDPVTYGVTIRRDLPPEIELLDPRETEKDVPANTEVLPLLYKARDPDFKLRFVTLRGDLTRSAGNGAAPEGITEPVFNGAIDGEKKSLTATWDWRLQGLNLKPGDTLTFRLEARDNKQPRGNTASTRKVTLRIVEPVDRQQLKQQLQNQRDRQNRQQQQQRQNHGASGRQPPDQPNDRQQKKQDGQQRGKPQKGADGGQGKAGPGKSKKQQGANQKNGMGQPEQKNDRNGGEGNARQPNQTEGDMPPRPESPEETIARLRQNTPQEPKPNQSGKKQAQPKGKQPNNGMQPDGMKQSGTQPEGTKQPGTKQQGTKQQGTKSNGMPQNAGQEQPQNAGNKQQKQPNDGMGGEKPANGGKKQQSPENPGKKTRQQKSPAAGQGGNEQKNNGTAGTAGNKTEGMKPETGGPMQPGTGGKKKKTGPDKTVGTPSPTPMGPQERVRNGGPGAQKKQAKGNETGPAEPDENANSNSKAAKKPNGLQRREGTKAVKKQRSAKGNSNAGQRRSENPEKVPSKAARKQTPANAVENKTPSKDNTGGAAKTRNDQQKPGNETPKGSNSKPQPEAKKPADGGKRGSPSPKEQGNSNSRQQGAGDESQGKGNPQHGTKKPSANGGAKSDAGPKAQKKAAGSKPGGKSQGADNNSAAGSKGAPSPMKGVGGSQGGNRPGTGGLPGNPKPGPEGPGGGGPFGKSKGKAPPPENVQQQDETDLEAGRKIGNLVLDNAEGKLKRGEADETWLKKHGWTSRQQALEDIRRAREFLKSAGQDAQATEFARSLRHMKFRSQFQKRSGEKVLKKEIQGVGRRGSGEIPPYLREYYRAFDNSVKRSR